MELSQTAAFKSSVSETLSGASAHVQSCFCCFHLSCHPAELVASTCSSWYSALFIFLFQHWRLNSPVCPIVPAEEEMRLGEVGTPRILIGERKHVTLCRLRNVRNGNRFAPRWIPRERPALAPQTRNTAGSGVKPTWTWRSSAQTAHPQVILLCKLSDRKLKKSLWQNLLRLLCKLGPFTHFLKKVSHKNPCFWRKTEYLERILSIRDN